MARTPVFAAVLCAALLLAAALAGHAADPHAAARDALLAEIARDVRMTSDYILRRELDPRVMAAMARVPRHEFVPADSRHLAWENRPLRIGYGQTISQPYIVAIMTDLLETQPGCRAFEVGAGSGYQAAVLAEVCDEVYTLEIIEPLGRQAAARLKRLRYDNVRVKVGDGYYGWPEHGPFDAIVVTAVASHVPPPLVAQLKPGGRMVLPVGTRFTTQQLVLVEKRENGKVRTRQLLPVRFVPLTGGHD